MRWHDEGRTKDGKIRHPADVSVGKILMLDTPILLLILVIRALALEVMELTLSGV